MFVASWWVGQRYLKLTDLPALTMIIWFIAVAALAYASPFLADYLDRWPALVLKVVVFGIVAYLMFWKKIQAFLKSN